MKKTQIEALDHELAKADRRTAEQERIIGKQREIIANLRRALSAALDELVMHMDDSVGTSERSAELADPRIVRWRKLATP